MPSKLLLVISLATVLIISMLNISFTFGYRIMERYVPLLDASMVIKLEAASAHLWFEELISNDEAESIDAVLSHLDRAVWYANAMLHGGENHKGRFLALQDPLLIDDAEKIVVQLQRFRSMTLQRFQNFKSSGIGSDIDQRYDALFKRLLVSADQLEAGLQHNVDVKLRQFEQVHTLLILFLLLLATIVFGFFFRYERERAKNLAQIHASNDALKRLSMMDALTAIANRRHFDDCFENEWQRAIREKSPLSVLMIDVDYFKAFNDHYGHLAGDECLIKIATTLASAFRRPADLVARFGGEEFSVILPNSVESYNDAMRCNELIEGLAIPHVKGKVVTVSIGVASMVPRLDTPATELIKRADQALYAAKSEGRNRVVLAS
ncbi:MAG: diguanylate cyclase [Gammaproteobacteria bacterium]|nr:diguanylate cyclase [Gammaproteobacteria bacterium]